MKSFLILCFLTGFLTSLEAQRVGSKVSFSAIDSKTYTGVVAEIQGDKYNIKYDGMEFSSWLTANQFKVIDEPALPSAPPAPATAPEVPPAPGETPASVPNGGSGQLNGGIPGQGSQPTSSTTMTAADSLKLAITNLKTAFADVNKLFAKKSDTVLIVIPAIDYDNSSLAQLKDNLKKLKNVRSVTMRYNTTTATLQVAFKGKPTELWDTLPPDAKAAFKLTELGDTNISLQYKQKTL